MSKKVFNYMEKTADLCDVLVEKQDQGLTIVEALVNVKDQIAEIADYVRSTELFKESQLKYEEYKARFLSMSDKKERLLDAWGQFVIKTCHAPTRLHLKGVVILNIPIIDDFLKDL